MFAIAGWNLLANNHLEDETTALTWTPNSALLGITVAFSYGLTDHTEGDIKKQNVSSSPKVMTMHKDKQSWGKFCGERVRRSVKVCFG